MLKITKYHTTTKIGSPKLNYNFFFHFTAQCDSVHTFAVDGRHCTSREGNYSVLWCLHTNYTNYQRYGFLKICLPSSLLSVMIPMLLIFWKDVQFSAQDIVRSGLGDVGSCGDADRKSTMIYTQGSNSG